MIWDIFSILGIIITVVFGISAMTFDGLHLSEEQIKKIKVIEETDPSKILFEIDNQELKTALIKKYGFNNLIEKTQYKIVHEDDFGKLIKISHNGADHFFVKVINGTPEIDSSFKEYYLKVPPDMDTAKEAVAWTYGLHPNEYHLIDRT